MREPEISGGEMTCLQVGYGDAVITPPLGSPGRVGLTHQLNLPGDPILLRALNLRDGGGSEVLQITAEVVGLTADLMAMIRERIFGKPVPLIYGMGCAGDINTGKFCVEGNDVEVAGFGIRLGDDPGEFRSQLCPGSGFVSTSGLVWRGTDNAYPQRSGDHRYDYRDGSSAIEGKGFREFDAEG